MRKCTCLLHLQFLLHDAVTRIVLLIMCIASAHPSDTVTRMSKKRLRTVMWVHVGSALLAWPPERTCVAYSRISVDHSGKVS